MNQTTKKILITLKEYVIISLGLALYCFSWTSFLIPKGIVGGAIPGLATFVNYATGGLIPVSVTYLSVNVILIILGFLILGRGFGFKTIYCILLNSVLLQVLPDLIPWVSTIEEPFLNGLLGGFIGAIGIVMIFNLRAEVPAVPTSSPSFCPNTGRYLRAGFTFSAIWLS